MQPVRRRDHDGVDAAGSIEKLLPRRKSRLWWYVVSLGKVFEALLGWIRYGYNSSLAGMTTTVPGVLPAPVARSEDAYLQRAAFWITFGHWLP